MPDLHSFRLIFVIEQAYLFADEFGWCFKEAIVDGDGSIPGDPSPDFLAKMIFQVSRGRTDQFDMFTETIQWRLGCTGVTTLVIFLTDPEIQGDVDISK